MVGADVDAAGLIFRGQGLEKLALGQLRVVSQYKVCRHNVSRIVKTSCSFGDNVCRSFWVMRCNG